MKIVVCAKQVPMSHRAGMDKTTYTVDRTNSSLMINPVDEHALEVALQIKDLLGAQISVITMGPKQASSLLKYAASLGADELYHIDDIVYAGSDTYATSLILSSSIEYIGGADLVVCGTRSFDGETGHVGPQISVKLHMPCYI